MSSSKLNVNLFKNIKEDQFGEINTLLANLSVGDTSHDFGEDKKTASGIPSCDKTVESLKDIYNEGMPNVFTSIQSESDLLSSVVGENSFKIPKYSPLDIVKTVSKGQTLNHSLTTVNLNNYDVRYINVKPNNLVQSSEFFAGLGFFDGSIVPSKNIGLVIDCVSIKLLEIIKNGNLLGDQFKLFLVKAPEIENDPGGKTKVNDRIFNEDSSGAYLKAATPFNVTKNANYFYGYKSNTDSAYDQFFTKYSFQLSELQYETNFIFSSLSTTLTVKHPTFKIPSIVRNDSGSKNEIGFLSQIIRSILPRIKPNKYSPEDGFLFNASIQQKRSGDWLQALLVSSMLNGSRKFCEHKPSDTLGIIKKKDLAAEQGNEINFDEIYLCTHDRILLAFALILGINVIFTHHFKPLKDEPSVHSAFVYRIENPQAELARKNQMVANFLENIMSKDQNNIFIKTSYISKINSATISLQEFQNRRNAIIGAEEENLLLEITNARRKMITNPQLSTEVVDTHTRNIFTRAFRYNTINGGIPDLQLIINQLQNLTIALKEIESKLAGLKVNENDGSVLLNGSLIYKYEDIMRIKIDYENTLGSAEKNLDKISSGAIENMLSGIINSLKKNPSYQLAGSWTYRNEPKNNLWGQIKNVFKGKDYINDKQVFLHDLQMISPEVKNSIVDLYTDLYTRVEQGKNIGSLDNKNRFTELAPRMLPKFQSTVLSFCVEVFVTLIGGVDNTLPVIEIIKTYINNKNTILIDECIASGDADILDYNRFLSLEAENVELTNVEYITQQDSMIELLDENINFDNVKESNLVVTILDETIVENIVEEILPELRTVSEGDNLTKPLVNEAGIDLPGERDYNQPEDEQAIQSGGNQRGGAPALKFNVDYQNTKATATLLEVKLFAYDKPNFKYESVEMEVEEKEPMQVEEEAMQVEEQPIEEVKEEEPIQEEKDPMQIQEEKEIEVEEAPSRKRKAEEQLTKDTIVGGANESELSKLFDEIETSLVSLIPNKNQTQSDKQQNIFVNDSCSFHPLLPLYLIIGSYYKEIQTTPIDQTWDYDIYIKFYMTLRKMIQQLVMLYENDSNIHKYQAILVSYGLRELLFTSNQYIERDPLCMEILKFDKNTYNEFSTMCSMLSYSICGSINQIESQQKAGNVYLSSTLFKNYIDSLSLSSIWQIDVPNIDNLQFDVLKLYLLIGNKIAMEQRGKEYPGLLKNVNDLLNSIGLEPIIRVDNPSPVDNLSPINSPIQADNVAHVDNLARGVTALGLPIPKRNIITDEWLAEKPAYDNKYYNLETRISNGQIEYKLLSKQTGIKVFKPQDERNLDGTIVNTPAQQQRRRGGKITRKYKKSKKSKKSKKVKSSKNRTYKKKKNSNTRKI